MNPNIIFPLTELTNPIITLHKDNFSQL